MRIPVKYTDTIYKLEVFSRYSAQKYRKTQVNFNRWKHDLLHNTAEYTCDREYDLNRKNNA
jgi:hypothetical protein